MPWIRIKTWEKLNNSKRFRRRDGYLSNKWKHPVLIHDSGVAFNKPMADLGGKLVYVDEIGPNNRIFSWNFIPEMFHVITDPSELTEDEKIMIAECRLDGVSSLE